MNFGNSCFSTMFSKLDNVICIERKRPSRKPSFLIRDILEEDDDREEDVVVADDDDYPPSHPQGPSMLALPQGGPLWESHVIPFHQSLGPTLTEEHTILLSGPSRSQHPQRLCTGSLSLCCLNCPPQSWHTGFPEVVSPGTGASTAGAWAPGAERAGKEAAAARAPAARKARRNRTVFTELQLMGLERRFDCQKYLSTPDRAELARALGLTQLQVKTWYQNRRMKWKKQVMQGGCTVPPTKPKGRPKKNSIPSLNETRSCAEMAILKEPF